MQLPEFVTLMHTSGAAGLVFWSQPSENCVAAASYQYGLGWNSSKGRAAGRVLWVHKIQHSHLNTYIAPTSSLPCPSSTLFL